MADWDFSGYVLDSVRVDEYDINWKTFVETYLEVYHVDFYHPGLGNFTDCDNFTVDYGDEYSVQIVAPKAASERPGTPVYRKWHEACLKQLDGRPPNTARCGRRTSRASRSSGIRTCSSSPPDPALAHAHHQRRGVLLPRGNRPLRARVHRGAAGGVRRDRDRGQRDLRALDAAAAALYEAGTTTPALPVTDGRCRGALPRVAARKLGR
jgi:hypothetical protein